jgi:hypothetical protein
MWLWPANEKTELVLGMQAPQFEEGLYACEDQSWFKVQAVPML